MKQETGGGGVTANPQAHCAQVISLPRIDEEIQAGLPLSIMPAMANQNQPTKQNETPAIVYENVPAMKPDLHEKCEMVSEPLNPGAELSKPCSPKTEVEDTKQAEEKVMTRSTEENKTCSPRKSKNRKQCTESCVACKKQLNERITTLNNEKTSLTQENETLKVHQDSLRSTIASLNDTVESQSSIIKENNNKLESQKKLIREQEIEICTQNDLAGTIITACMDESMEGEKGE